MAPYLSIRVLLLNGGVSLRFVEPAIWALYAVISHRAVARSGRGCQRSSGSRLVKASVCASEHTHHERSLIMNAASITCAERQRLSVRHSVCVSVLTDVGHHHLHRRDRRHARHGPRRHSRTLSSPAARARIMRTCSCRRRDRSARAPAARPRQPRARPPWPRLAAQPRLACLPRHALFCRRSAGPARSRPPA